MEIEVGKYYKTRDGKRAYIGYIIPPKESLSRYTAMGHIVGTPLNWTKTGTFFRVNYKSPSDLVALWEEPEEIDVSNIWVEITFMDNSYAESGEYFPNKADIKRKGITYAIVSVKDWQAIQRGERKLIKGEGL